MSSATVNVREDDPGRDRRAGCREHLEHGDEPGARRDDRVQASRHALVEARHRTGGDLHPEREQQGAEDDRHEPERAAPGEAADLGCGVLVAGPRTGGTGWSRSGRHRTPPQVEDRAPRMVHLLQRSRYGEVLPRVTVRSRALASAPARSAPRRARVADRYVRRAVHEHGVSARHAVSTARRVDPPGRLTRRNQGFPAPRDRLTLPPDRSRLDHRPDTDRNPRCGPTRPPRDVRPGPWIRKER